MTIPMHVLHLYQKPKLGNGFIRRYPALQYTHKISAMGGFDTASCNIRLTVPEAEIALADWIGNRVAFYVDNPLEPIFEGFISRVTPEFGNVIPTRSLENMFNRIKGMSSGGGTNNQTAASNNILSQALYGIKEGSQEQWFDSAPAAGRRTQALVDFMIAWQSNPQTSVNLGQGGRAVHVEISGFYKTLDWENIRDTGFTLIAQNTLVATLMGALGNGTTFFDNTDTSQIEANAITANDNVTRGETAWQQIVKWTESGDGTNRYIAGITPTNPSTGQRALYYKQADVSTKYTVRISDGGRVRNPFGGLVRPWTVRPDGVVRINDLMNWWNGDGDDPREFYIELVDYRAEDQIATLYGADDPTIEGVIQARKFTQMHGSRFGPPPRLI